MTNANIFGLWVLSILIGSVVFGLGAFMFSRESEIELFLMMAGISAIASSLFSIPAIIIFIIVNVYFQKSETDNTVYRRKMYNTQLIVTGIYFVLTMAFIMADGAGMKGFGGLCGLLVSYLTPGMLLWRYYFNKQNNGKLIHSEELLDNF
jgi:uncharacterized RDD family membrane protein YckC